MSDFHEIRFPLDVSLGGRGGPERRTEIVTLGSNREARNARWAHSRRRYEAGYGVKSLAQLAQIIEFFEERRGRLYGFRWRDRADCCSCAPGAAPSPTDQEIGTGDGARDAFQLVKTYGGAFSPYARDIVKPVAGTPRVAVDGVEKSAPEVSVDATTGVVTFAPGAIPSTGAVVTAGFFFDVPARFDTDFLEIDMQAFEAGVIPNIPIIEIVP
ncbi:MAG: TIGR02217 family protein [Alphaproteobacteria bacterium]|nr:TIGR02217 family protein [Alphaproteobacteria bacterium]MBM3623988.1 TIGR02217 family protein [Alphaproteobacteria bacterium]